MDLHLSLCNYVFNTSNAKVILSNVATAQSRSFCLERKWLVFQSSAISEYRLNPTNFRITCDKMFPLQLIINVSHVSSSKFCLWDARHLENATPHTVVPNVKPTSKLQLTPTIKTNVYQTSRLIVFFFSQYLDRKEYYKPTSAR